jgi:LAGLIDADG-like domain
MFKRLLPKRVEMGDKIYFGTLLPVNHEKTGEVTAYRVSTTIPGYSSKYFSASNYGNVELAEQAAIAYQIYVSDKHGKTVVRPSMEGFWNRLVNLGFLHWQEDSDQYVAGLFDGDGCISMDSDTGIVVTISQACDKEVPLVIQYLRHKYDARYTLHKARKDEHRDQHVVSVYDRYARELLTHIAEHSILKVDQARAALSYMNREADRDTVRSYLTASKVFDAYRKVDVYRYQDRLTAPYMAGLFDAEGCAVCDPTGRVHNKIYQFSSLKLLELIREHYGGTIHISKKSAEVCWCGIEAVNLYRLIEPYLVHKREQVVCCMKIHEYSVVPGRKRTAEDKKNVAQLAAYVKAQKHH